MPDLLVRGVPENVVAALKDQAAQNRRSLQQELLLLLEESVRKDCSSAVQSAALIRERLSGNGRSFSDSTEQIRDDRGR